MGGCMGKPEAEPAGVAKESKQTLGHGAGDQVPTQQALSEGASVQGVVAAAPDAAKNAKLLQQEPAGSSSPAGSGLGAASLQQEAAAAPEVQHPQPGMNGNQPHSAVEQPAGGAQQQSPISTPTPTSTMPAADIPSSPPPIAPVLPESNGSPLAPATLPGSNLGNRPGPSTGMQQSSSAEVGDLAPTSSGSASTWDKAKMLFSLTKPEELLTDLHDLKYIGAGGYGKVFKAVWRSAPVAVKLVPSHSPELFKSSSYKEALLCKELCHPNIVQTYETRCAQLSEEFVRSILEVTEVNMQKNVGASNNTGGSITHSYGSQVGHSQEFVSGDGFGLPSPVPDMVVKGKTLPEAAAKWKDILFTTGAKPGDYLTVIIMDFCDYGSLVRPIMKGMFRPFSASGSDREARVRYRALLRTAKEIAQGLEHLHHLKVVHGDLKPGNVLLKGSRVDVRGFNAQVIDFGLSHMVNNSNPQKVSKAGGTLVYAAPEVFSGRVGKAADVYSLGIILWEMVTGSQPYKDMAEGQIVLGVQKGGLRPAWPAGQLPQLQELYERCVAQDPDSRPKAKEVVQFLTQIEMDLRSELKAAHKQQMQMHAAVQAQQMQANMAAAGPDGHAHAVGAQRV